MPVSSATTGKQLKAFAMGELCGFQHPSAGETIGIPFQRRDADTVWIAAILAHTADGNTLPAHMAAVGEDTWCLSYGMNWVLRTMPPGLSEGLGLGRRIEEVFVAGNVILYGERTLMHFGPDPTGATTAAGTLDLSTHTLYTNGYAEGMAVATRWDLWARGADAELLRTRPLTAMNV